MARPLRIEYEGAHYHVMSRGNGRQIVFTKAGDYELFLGRLGRFCRQFDVAPLCYCCMANHFHLYIQTRQANLSRFMHSLLTSFVLMRTADKREQPAVERARRSVPFDEVARCVGRQYGVGPDSLMALRGSDRQARRLLMYGVCCYSRAGESLTALAGRFGISLSGLTMACSRIEQQLRRDKTLLQAWLRIEEQLKRL